MRPKVSCASTASSHFCKDLRVGLSLQSDTWCSSPLFLALNGKANSAINPIRYITFNFHFKLHLSANGSLIPSVRCIWKIMMKHIYWLLILRFSWHMGKPVAVFWNSVMENSRVDIYRTETENNFLAWTEVKSDISCKPCSVSLDTFRVCLIPSFWLSQLDVAKPALLFFFLLHLLYSSYHMWLNSF